MWIEIRIGGKAEMVNLATAERVYENAEGVTCIELRDGIIETETPYRTITFRMIQAGFLASGAPVDK